MAATPRNPKLEESNQPVPRGDQPDGGTRPDADNETIADRLYDEADDLVEDAEPEEDDESADDGSKEFERRDD